MLFLYTDEKQRFIKGYHFLKDIMNSEECLKSPWDIPLINSDFKLYAEAKDLLTKKLDKEILKAKTIYSNNFKVMILHSEYAGIHGLLKKNGAEISIAVNDNLRKVTISFTDKTTHYARTICNHLNMIENGWGGHIERGIIASPFKGTSLDESCLVSAIKKELCKNK